MSASEPKPRAAGPAPDPGPPPPAAALLRGQAQPGRETENDADLVERARRGDRQAADRLIRRHLNRVHRIVYPLCGFDAEEARDVVQEVFLQAFRSLPAFAGRARFSTWLYRIAVNAALDARRRRRRWSDFFPGRRRTEDDDEAERGDPLEAAAAPLEETDPVARIAAGELEAEVRRAIGRLSRHQQTVFALKVFEDMSIAEIAELTGMAEGTVKSHLFRATRSLREQLGPRFDRTGRGGAP